MKKNLYKEINSLIKISKYAGERFDLVQSAGGNSSIKLKNGTMLIKSSGVTLSDLNFNFGFTKVNNKKIKLILNNKQILKIKNKKKKEFLAQKLLKRANLEKKSKPSIEVFLHSLLNKITLHTHPICVNNVVCSPNWKKNLNKIFNNNNYLFVKYKSPGIELALELKKEVEKYFSINKFLPKIIFLQNHGLIITDGTTKKVIELTNYITLAIERFIKTDYSIYRLTNKISNLVRKTYKDKNLISYLSEDKIINDKVLNKKFLFSKPTCPDTFVFNGIKPCKLKNLHDELSLKKFKKKYKSFSKILIFRKNIFLINKSVKKTKSMEEMLKFHLLVMKKLYDKPLYLLDKEMQYLSNLETEKYRQNI